VNPIAIVYIGIGFLLVLLLCFVVGITCGINVLRVQQRCRRLEQANVWEREQRNNAIKAMDSAQLRGDDMAHENRILLDKVSRLMRENDELSRALHGNMEAAPILAVMEGRVP